MKKSRHSTEQIIRILREADAGASTEEEFRTLIPNTQAFGMQTRNLGSKQRVTAGRGGTAREARLVESFLRKGVPGSGFEIGLEGQGTPLAGESGSACDIERGVLGGGGVFAAIVLLYATAQVAR